MNARLFQGELAFTWVLFLTAIMGSSCHSTVRETENAASRPVFHYNPYAEISQGESMLQDGDLVVRLHQDPSSNLIRHFNRQDKRFSHAGIVLMIKGKPMVFHIVNGEESPDECLRCDSLGAFCNPRKNIAFGIYRYDLSEEEKKSMARLIQTWKKQKVRFDPLFDLQTDSLMYCSEMIGKALSQATHNRIMIASTRLTPFEAKMLASRRHLPYHPAEVSQVFSIDNLYLHPSCRMIGLFSLAAREEASFTQTSIPIKQ